MGKESVLVAAVSLGQLCASGSNTVDEIIFHGSSFKSLLEFTAAQFLIENFFAITHE